MLLSHIIDPLGLAGFTKDGKGNDIPLDAYRISDKTMFEPDPSIKTKYKRKLGTTSDQKDLVAGQPCVVCGTTNNIQVPDHKDALVVEYYRTGNNDTVLQNSTSAVQAHCSKCSSIQGGKASSFSKEMRKKLGI
ncbi:hypothetical protein F4W09_00015 [Acinetobacter tandoii]|uniref:Uncharacterized protein n=1 Tax=Acinetobacter tandoii TaxID=202954 RepID=A0A5N4WTF2_9GAMM|nr:hypothetical protein [Acinetobacter tandoii]KAB1859560.1 hypothetical protein F4W09_00015 [Acinetobacter tandoii]